MKFQPRPFQTVGITHAVKTLESRGKQLYAAPTGVGKSIIELEVQAALPGTWIVSPREEILSGMLDKLEYSGDMLDKQLCTPIRLRNLLLRGEVQHPKYLIFDEGHHHNAETWQQLDLLAGLCPSIAYTATPYRGSPKGTRELIERWGEPAWIITYREACDAGYISMPKFEMLPLVDDDLVDVRGGEFDVTSIDGVTVDRLGDMAEHSRRWYTDRWDRPTIFALPSSACCVRLHEELASRGLPSAVVSAATDSTTRYAAFEAAKRCFLAILHINIVSEGVDLPLRRLVDLAPTMSPVKWVQQLGRITRPADEPPEYICTNRNILRHSYALEGVVPVSAVVEAERSFPSTERAHARVLGLEAIGRFKPDAVKLRSGLKVHIYNLSTVVDNVVVQYCVLVHPTERPVWATKVNLVVDGVKQWGTWRGCDPPTDVRGFSSVGPRELSDKQRNWWNRSASRFGLDSEQEVTKKNFQALPVLSDLGFRYT